MVSFSAIIFPLILPGDVKYIFNTKGTVAVMNELRKVILTNKLAAFGSLAAAVGGIFAAFVLLKMAHDYMEGQGLSLGSVLRPFFILLCICNFNSFVITPLHYVCNVFTEGVSNMASITCEDYVTQLGKNAWTRTKSLPNKVVHTYSEHKKEIEEEQHIKRNGKERSWIGKAWDKFSAVTVSAVLGIAEGAGSILDGAVALPIELIFGALLTVLLRFIVFGQQIYCYVYLILLSLLGPFAFAFGILNSFSSSIRSWIARYIQVALWIPVGQIIMFISFQILCNFASIAAGFTFGTSLIELIALAVAIMNVLAVPKICAYVIDSTGTNEAHGTVNNAAKAAAATAAKAASMI